MMTTTEPIIDTFRAVCAERPTFAAMALTALHDRDQTIANLRRQLAITTIWLRVWDAYRKLPTPRPEMTAAQINQITADVIAAIQQEQG